MDSRFYDGEPGMGGWYTEMEMNAISKVLEDAKNWNSGFKAQESRLNFENEFSSYVNSKYAVAVNSAGTGLDLVMMALNIEKGDEIISCAINFPGTHLSIIGQKAKLILAEPDPKTLNIDYVDMEKKITKRTRAIVITHMNGLCADVDKIHEVLKRHRHFKKGEIKIIIDAARACGSRDNNSYAGEKGWATVFSFQTKKIITTLGEGGMITTNDKFLLEKLRRLRAFGMGESWGSNFHLTKIQAEVGRIQLLRLDEMVKKRIEIAEKRNYLLRHLDAEIISTYENFKNIYYLYTIILPENDNNMQVSIKQEMLKNYNIKLSIGNKPTYQKNKLIARKVKSQYLPISDNIGNRIVCLPIHPLMSDEENEFIATSLIKSYKTCQ
jgi:dTDP-4-amino-4,6-dideoxygalactose transaminase